MLLFYMLAILALVIGTAGIYLPLIEKVPVSWVYYHYFIRKPINWLILICLMVLTFFLLIEEEAFPMWTIIPLIISCLALVLTYRMHQDVAFRAVDYPAMTTEISNLPIKDDMQIAVIEYEGVIKCYPLDYVIHHHIINDRFNSKIVALTYCAMCRSIIPFDVTKIGPLFVGSFKNANMIVADRKTKTFFQQATFQSIIGQLHPSELMMIPFQILPWSEIKGSFKNMQIVKVVESDFREFELPIPGIWKKIMNSESTPGLSEKNRDKTFSARTHVIGITDSFVKESLAYLKEEVIESKFVINVANSFCLIAVGDTVNGFKTNVKNSSPDLYMENNELVDKNSGTRWSIRGKYISGALNEDLLSLSISDEYWFSWKRFHNDTTIIRL